MVRVNNTHESDVIFMKSPLEGIKVVDISQVIAAPICARHLGDFGAEVIHVENTKSGDFWRKYLSDVGGVTAVPSNIDYNWEVFNRNKKSVALDLDKKEGQEILNKMVACADIVVTNLRQYEREKFACSYTHLTKINPRIIYGSITGVGKNGPECDNPAFDQTAYWNRAGVNQATLPPGVHDTGFRPGLGDTVAGVSLYAAIMTALFHRERTGVGQEVEISLLGTGLYQLSFDISGALVTGKDFKDIDTEKLGNHDSVIVEREKLTERVNKSYNELWQHIKMNQPNPLYGSYATKDSHVVHINILQPDRYWEKICHALNLENLVDDFRFNRHETRIKHHKDLYQIIKTTFSNFMFDDIYDRLVEWGIPFAEQQKISHVIHDPQTRINKYFVNFSHPTYGSIEILANHMKMSRTPANYRLPAPEFSQHTEETLLNLGYGWEDIAMLKENKVIP